MIDPFLLPINKLSTDEKAAMFSLLKNHFEGVDLRQFTEDLDGKNWAILLKKEGVLKGFSTLQFYQSQFNGELVRIVYSGDTITDPSVWSSPALAQAWIEAIQEIHRGHSEKLYWLLISSGYRTYRFLSIFFKIFYPCDQQLNPPEFLSFMHHLAIAKFGNSYDPVTGIVRFPHPQILSPELRSIPAEKLQDSHVAFFAQKNPGYVNGDELVCLAEITESNLTKAGLRMWKTGIELKTPFPIDLHNL